MASLTAFLSRNSDCGDCMFVFPTTYMNGQNVFDPLEGITTLVEGHVTMVCRTPPSDPEA